MTHARRLNAGVGVHFIDLDGFKGVNDSQGHAARDSVLKSVAEQLKTGLREGDRARRIGGDEPLVVLPDCGDGETLDVLGRRVGTLLSMTLDWEGHKMKIGARVGAALFPGDGQDPAAPIGAADQAMYLAKQSGGGYRCT